MEAEQIIRRPLMLTEKGTKLRDADNKYLFEVDRRANKVQIKKAIEKLFEVTVVDVNTLVVRGRHRRMGRGHALTKSWKKAIVQLASGESIDFYEEG
jgi:large subunit ribosomal protein L23